MRTAFDEGLIAAAQVLNGGRAEKDLVDVRGQKRIRIGNAAALQRREFPEVQYIVPGIIAPGLTIFAGKPKIGKSWFCMDLLLSVAGDRYCLGDIKCDQGNVLYLALEDNERRLWKRIAKIVPPSAEWPQLFEYATEWPRASDGGTGAIRDWCKSVPNPRLIVVDVLAAFRSERRNQQSPYEADYAAIKDLQKIALDFPTVAIMVVHHTRKAGADVDRFDLVSGTLGLSGAADTALILDRDALGCRLYGRGRDLEELDRVIEFKGESCRWFLRGDASELRRSDEREALITVLLEADEPMSPADISGAAGMPGVNVRQLLYKMSKDGEIRKLKGRGKYIHPDRSDLDPDNNDNKADNNGGDDE